MSEACPIPTDAERTYGAIHSKAKADMMRAVHAAIEQATERARKEIEAAALDIPAPPHGYFLATAHQQLFCTLCGADPETLAGGRRDLAAPIIRNAENVANAW